MQSDAKTVSLRYRPFYEGVPPPQPIRLEVPGWAGDADKMVDGATPQPWHCRPYADAAVYGLELRFADNAEWSVSQELDAIVFRKNGVPLHIRDIKRFAAAGKHHYGCAFSLDIEVPAGFVLRVESHPRFYTDRTGNVPAVVPGHIGPAWYDGQFIVFKNPLSNEVHRFRPGLPYAQVFLVPEQARYQAELMSLYDQHARHARRERIGEYTTVNARFWKSKDGDWFNDTYKRLYKAHRLGGDALVEKEIVRPDERLLLSDLRQQLLAKLPGHEITLIDNPWVRYSGIKIDYSEQSPYLFGLEFESPNFNRLYGGIIRKVEKSPVHGNEYESLVSSFGDASQNDLWLWWRHTSPSDSLLPIARDWQASQEPWAEIKTGKMTLKIVEAFMRTHAVLTACGVG